MKRTSAVLASIFSLSLWGCNAPDSIDLDDVKADSVDGKADSSAISTILDFEFDGELQTASGWGAESMVRDQMLYTIGHLNANNSVGRLDKLVLTNIRQDGTKVTYHAKMPVAWGAKTNLPTKYDFTLPKNADDYVGFTNKYKESCVDFGAHEVDEGSMWYYYRPNKSGCSLAAADVVKFSAKVTVSTVNTNGKYPEYDKVWEDGTFNVVSIFGKYEDGATSTSDAGIDAYNTFVSKVKAKFPTATVTPADAGSAPGATKPDVQFNVTLADGRKVQINALLVDNIASATTTFYNRYNGLSTRADLIAYNGHAGLGQNVRALARKGSWVKGQYVMVFMNGCDTYAYVDGYLVDARKSINPDDPNGTKYLDFIVNGMPAYFASDAAATMALVNAVIASNTAPLTYQSIFANIDSSQVVMVTGEQDNVYQPGGGGGTTNPPAGGLLDEKADVDAGESLNFVTGDLDAGAYTVTLSADAGDTGDADLYVKVGAAPTSSVYDCRPYKDGSNEECKVTLSSKAKIYVMVNGYSAAKFALKVTKDGSTPPPATWAGINESFSVAKNEEKRYQTPVLPAGTYSFTLSGSGDADLYVRVGQAPQSTSNQWDCRPYKSGSAELCTMNLTAAAPIHVMVRGYAATSSVKLVAAKN